MSANLVFSQFEFADEAYQRLRLRLDVYDEAVFAQRYGKNGQPCAGFMVDPLDLAAAFADVNVSTPALPRGTLFWGRCDGGQQIAVYDPPRRATLALAEGVWKDAETLEVPLPGLVFLGKGKTYYLFAVKTQGGWPHPNEGLFHAPLPNVYSTRDNQQTGLICWGAVRPPAASTETIWTAFALFVQSAFNRHLIGGKSKAEPGDILTFLRGLDGETYPVKDLRPANTTLQQLVQR